MVILEVRVYDPRLVPIWFAVDYCFGTFVSVAKPYDLNDMCYAIRLLLV